MEISTRRLSCAGSHLRRLSMLLLLGLSLAPAPGWAEQGDKSAKPEAFEAQLERIKHIIVIYQENWSFDSLYGGFPGANGTSRASSDALNQIDRISGKPLTWSLGTPYNLVSGSTPVLNTPPQPLDANGNIDTRFPASFNTLLPYNAGTYLAVGDITGDIVHRYWHEQSQINGGKMNQFITWSDNPGLVMSYFDATNLPEGKLAQQFTMSDNLFHSAFGGSFLNHQFLIAAAAPVFPNAATATPSSLPVLDASGHLTLGPNGKIVQDGKITPVNATFEHNFAVNTIYTVNMVPTFKKTTDTDLLPSQNDSNPKDPARHFLPTIGDRLNEQKISWKWYSGGWDAAIASTLSNPNPANPATVDPLFQWHHQPLAYFDNFAPFLPSGQRNPVSMAHLQDETNFLNDIKNKTLPHVSIIKPLGPNNEHPGYADLLTGQQHVADLVQAVQQSKYWDDCLIIITYDENGGRWDHVPPPSIDKWGPGTRVPTIIIGPTVKRGYVDHTQYETDSILSLIEQRFHLKPLSTRDAHADPFTHVFRSEQHDRD